jgi:hypothetical protein
VVLGRIGGSAVDFYNSGGATLKRTVTASQWKTAGVAFRISGLGTATPILKFQDDDNVQVDLRIDTQGRLVATRNGTVLGTSTERLLATVWQFIELQVKVSNTVGIVKVRVSENEWLSLAGIDTQSTANAWINRIRLGPSAPGVNIHYTFDDFYLSYGDWFYGESRVETQRPNRAGTYTEMTPNVGLNWQCVDDATPDDDTTYNRAVVLGKRDTYGFVPFTAQGVILAVQVTLCHRKDDVSSRYVAPMIRSGGVDVDGDPLLCYDSYMCGSFVWGVDPATGLPFDLTSLNASEFGMKLVG